MSVDDACEIAARHEQAWQAERERWQAKEKALRALVDELEAAADRLGDRYTGYDYAAESLRVILDGQE